MTIFQTDFNFFLRSNLHTTSMFSPNIFPHLPLQTLVSYENFFTLTRFPNETCFSLSNFSSNICKTLKTSSNFSALLLMKWKQKEANRSIISHDPIKLSRCGYENILPSLKGKFGKPFRGNLLSKRFWVVKISIFILNDFDGGEFVAGNGWKLVSFWVKI